MPTYESSVESLAKVADALNELYERLARVNEIAERRVQLGGDVEGDMQAMREAISQMAERITRIEEALISIVEQLAAIDYLNDLVEKIYVRLFKSSESDAT